MIGDAAPVSVPGDMAATSAESRMKNPAEAAREPVGYTIRDDRHGRTQDRLDYFAHGGVEAAGRVDRDQDQAGMFSIGLFDFTDDVFGEDGLDFAVNVKFDYGGICWRCWWRGLRMKRSGDDERKCGQCGGKQQRATNCAGEHFASHYSSGCGWGCKVPVRSRRDEEVDELKGWGALMETNRTPPERRRGRRERRTDPSLRSG